MAVRKRSVKWLILQNYCKFEQELLQIEPLSLLQVRVKFIANWTGNFIKNQAIFNTTWGRYYKFGKLYNFERFSKSMQLLQIGAEQ